MNKKVILFLLVISVLMFLPQNAQAAADPAIYFCTSVDEGWNPVDASDCFTGSRDTGADICMLVKLPYGVGCEKVKFEIYKGDKYSTTMTLKTKSTDRMFVKKIKFNEEGEYTISVYDEYGNFLVQGTVTMILNYGYKNHIFAFSEDNMAGRVSSE